ncbi:MAG: hypothetical protein H0W88_04550 [Parachlamydiaceae bacterium]|nr:hypothetical protein [Parachlamydiaceae bacterium]
MLKKNITLIGFQSSGKTTIGQQLALKLKKQFVDTDHLIEQKFIPLKCTQIYQQIGDESFRKHESEIIKRLENDVNIVIATGGGGIILEENQISLKQHSVLIYLRTPLELIKQRILTAKELPTYLDEKNPEDSLTRIYNFRSTIYESCADIVIDMNFQSPQYSLDLIIDYLK